MSFYIISFLLYGKFASWRDPFTTATTKSYLYPSNTNIIGILGAAVGISKEKELIDLQKNIYGIGIQGIFNKKTFSDRRLFLERLYNYSHINELERAKTIQTWEYIVNPKYKIIIITTNKEFAKRLKYYLENPEYPIYLGRSEFIGRVDEISLEKKNNIEKGKEIENTHINFDIFVQHKSSKVYIAKKLRRYNTKRKLYEIKFLDIFLEIIGKASTKDTIEMFYNIPIVKIY